ncbi:MAG: hypothetical protein IPN88_12770, partial [Bacteroidetes bacterium]|nr:hypothetical protein [Bacteroidota bacterium]
ADSNVVASGPTFTILDALNNNAGNGNLSPGSYQIIPSNLVQVDTPSNYILVYENGTLTVGPELNAIASAGIITFNGGTTTVNVVASGGTAPYTTLEIILFLQVVTFIYCHRCEWPQLATASVTVMEPSAIVPSASSAILCNGGTATISVFLANEIEPYSESATSV